MIAINFLFRKDFINFYANFGAMEVLNYFSINFHINFIFDINYFNLWKFNDFNVIIGWCLSFNNFTKDHLNFL